MKVFRGLLFAVAVLAVVTGIDVYPESRTESFVVAGVFAAVAIALPYLRVPRKR